MKITIYFAKKLPNSNATLKHPTCNSWHEIWQNNGFYRYCMNTLFDRDGFVIYQLSVLTKLSQHLYDARTVDQELKLSITHLVLK